MHAAVRRGDMNSFNDHFNLGNIVPRVTYSIRTSIPIIVNRGDKEIMVKAITDYELDEQGRPKFDLSPSALDSSSVQ